MNYKVFNKTEEKLNEEIKEIKKFLKFLLKKEKLKTAELNLIIINSDEMQHLNKVHRGIDKTTDVLSFALEENNKIIIPGNRILGDIYISVDVAKSQCKEFDNTLIEELLFLTVHGFLHLLGHDHMEDKKYKEMFDKQDELIKEYRK